MQKIVNKGDHIDGIFPISLGNTNYFHKMTYLDQEYSYQLEMTKVGSLNGTIFSFSKFNFPDNWITSKEMSLLNLLVMKLSFKTDG